MEDPLSLVANLIEIGSFTFLLFTFIRRKLTIRLITIIGKPIVGAYSSIVKIKDSHSQLVHSYIAFVHASLRLLLIKLTMFLVISSLIIIIAHLNNKSALESVTKVEKSPPSLEEKDSKSTDQPQFVIPKESSGKIGRTEPFLQTLQDIRTYPKTSKSSDRPPNQTVLAKNRSQTNRSRRNAITSGRMESGIRELGTSTSPSGVLIPGPNSAGEVLIDRTRQPSVDTSGIMDKLKTLSPEDRRRFWKGVTDFNNKHKK